MPRSGLVHACRGFLFVPLFVLMTASSAMAQNGTFNGRVTDNDGGVLPGVSVITVNLATGVVREATTNAQGVYILPGLNPGVFSVTMELPGFASQTRDNVRLDINQTLTLDVTLSLAGVEETVTVTGEAPLIETTQSNLSTSIEATELVNTPLVNRTITGMLALLPGAGPISPTHRSKSNAGTVSFAGSSGGNMSATVDGADNRDNHYGGPFMTFSTESLEQFQLSTSQFNVTDGRAPGAALSLVTKSGTNVFHGSGFIYERDEALTANDFFSKEAGLEEVPFSRQTFGGSVGGPIVRNRMFFFFAAEQMREVTGLAVPDDIFNHIEDIVAAVDAGQLAEGMVYRDHPRFAPTDARLRMMSARVNAQINNPHSLSYRWAYQKDERDNVRVEINNDNRNPEDLLLTAWSGVAQHSWVLGNRGLNQLTFHSAHMPMVSNSVSAITGEAYTANFPNVDLPPPNLDFPSASTGGGGSSGSTSDRWVIQLREDVSLLTGSHSIRTGFDYKHLPGLGLKNLNEHFATYSFFDDPAVILNNTNGLYPQGFQTPGAVAEWSQANGGAMNGVGSWADSTLTADQFGAWAQDDWRVTPNLTLNLGLRYDTDFGLMDQKNWENNLTRIALEQIGHPDGQLPKTARWDLSPRVGAAWDLSGVGTRVVRGGYGLYYDQFNTAAAGGDIIFLNRRPINAVALRQNSNVGVGQIPDYRFLIDPLFPQPQSVGALPSGATGEWISHDLVSPRVHHFHAGYAHTLRQNTVLTVDYTRTEGRHEWRQTNINPRVDGTRILAPQFEALNGDPNLMGRIDILASINESQYDALTFRVQQRSPRATLQAHYTLAAARAYGGSTGGRSGATASVDAFNPLSDAEWGPSETDELHRLVASGVFELPFGVQLSPVMQLASARPYNLTAGRDLNRDGTNNDFYVFPDGRSATRNSARGDHTFVVDIRTTKFFELGSTRRLGLFVEVLNLTDTVNFGAEYNGNGRSSAFQKPDGYIPGIGYPRQIQLGSRFLF